MNTFLILFGLLCFFGLVWKRREWGIYLIILLLPTYQIRFQVMSVPLTLLEMMILIAAGVEFYFLFRTKKLTATFYQQILQPARRTIPIIFFLLAALVSVSVSPVTAKAAGIFKAYFFEAILFYFLVLLVINNEKKLYRLWQSLAILICYLSVFALYQFVTLANLPFSWWGVNIASRRVTSLLNHPNALALLIGPIVAMLSMLLFTSRRFARNKLLLAAVILGLIALYLTFSRAAWLALVVTLILFGLLTKIRKKILIGVAAAVLLVLIIPYSRGKILDLARGNDPTQLNRYVLWDATKDILKKHPVYGVGLSGFHEAYKNYPLGPDRVIQNYPHSFFLNFWVEIGIVGLAALLGLLYFFQKKIRRLMNSTWRPIALAAAAGMSMIVLHGMVDVSYFKNDLSVLFWLIYALPNLDFLAHNNS